MILSDIDYETALNSYFLKFSFAVQFFHSFFNVILYRIKIKVLATVIGVMVVDVPEGRRMTHTTAIFSLLF